LLGLTTLPVTCHCNFDVMVGYDSYRCFGSWLVSVGRSRCGVEVTSETFAFELPSTDSTDGRVTGSVSEQTAPHLASSTA